MRTYFVSYATIMKEGNGYGYGNSDFSFNGAMTRDAIGIITNTLEAMPKHKDDSILILSWQEYEKIEDREENKLL